MKNIDRIQCADIKELVEIIDFELDSTMQYCKIVEWLEQELEE